MKKLIAVTALALSFAVNAEVETKSEQVELTSDQQQLSYAIGVVFGKRLAMEAEGLDIDAFDQGLRDSYSQQALKLTDQQIKQAFERFQQEKQAAMEQEFEQVSAENLQRGQQFLMLNAQEEGVNEIVKGLQYKVITAGEGQSPNASDEVEVHYQGQLLNGQVFDSSYKQDKPVRFKVNEVIPGWTKALQEMKEGDVWQVWIASDLAYGPGGSGPIGPNELLEFKVELLKVNP
ncbi:FKBP-type peptidyl-prolyl cis-trans isomerase [Litoribacillus peritrichatus]|uniref:Peptidyl-prolyl cis-trans isomerase n=1 Tax=Litoribacillus peritrichatus TaxID=718191 RepID=A0ABP7NE75_9GAMM